MNKTYKRSFSKPLLHFLAPPEADYVLLEVHEAICGNHTRGRPLGNKVIRTCYYWPTILKDSIAIVKHCDKCQRNAAIQCGPAETMTPINSPWPFTQWGIDILGPFPLEKGQVRFLAVAIDYFTKWVEAKPIASITKEQIRRFVWSSIMCRFSIPRILISINRS